MTTTVHNIRREQMRLGDVYIGRPGRGMRGYFGNPFRVNYPCEFCDGHDSPGDTIDCFEIYFQTRMAHSPRFRASVLHLAGKRLFCFCAPRRCHGDVIARFLNDLSTSEASRRTVVVRFPQRRTHDAPQAFDAREVGMRYYAGDEAFYPYRMTPEGLVLRSTTRGRSFILEESTGPCDPARWR